MNPATTTHLRLVPAPQLDPPYDDELPPAAPPVTGSLALAFPPSSQGLVPLRLVPPADGGPRDTARPLPDPASWARRLTQAIVEVLAGVRTVGQLAPFATLPVLEQLEAAVGALAHRGPGGTQARRPHVTSLRVCRLPATAVEVSSVVDTGRRSRALALRLEGTEGRWQCTALELG